MRILITGGTGFIGTHRVQHLQNQGHDVIVVGRTHNEYQGIVLYTDIADKDSIKQLAARYKPQRIEHFASQATVSVSRRDPYSTYKDNILGTISVLETAKELNIPVLLFTTDKYYGDLPSASEDDRPSIVPGAYETSKLCQDIIGQSYRKSGATVTIVRSCNVFGAHDYNSRIIPNSIRALQEGRQPIIFTNIRGVRQYIFIKDLLRALDAIQEKGQNDTFNVGTDIHLSQKEVVEMIVAVWNTHYDANVTPIYNEGPDLKEIPDQYLEWSKLHHLGWQPTYTFNDALKEMI